MESKPIHSENGYRERVLEVDTDYTHTGFVQDEIHLLGSKLSVTAGAKLEDNNFSGFDIQPTLRGLWNPNSHQSFWAAVTRAVTTPSRIEEGFQLSGGEISTTPPTYLLVSGNPNFKSETVLGYEGGYRQLLTPKLYIDLDVFHSNYDHLQSFGVPALIGDTLTIFYENAIAGATNGVEVAPSWTATPWWKLSGSYSCVGVDFHANAPVQISVRLDRCQPMKAPVRLTRGRFGPTLILESDSNSIRPTIM